MGAPPTSHPLPVPAYARSGAGTASWLRASGGTTNGPFASSHPLSQQFGALGRQVEIVPESSAARARAGDANAPLGSAGAHGQLDLQPSSSGGGEGHQACDRASDRTTDPGPRDDPARPVLPVAGVSQLPGGSSAAAPSAPSASAPQSHGVSSSATAASTGQEDNNISPRSQPQHLQSTAAPSSSSTSTSMTPPREDAADRASAAAAAPAPEDDDSPTSATLDCHGPAPRAP